MTKLAPSVEKVTLQIEMTASEADYLRRFAQAMYDENIFFEESHDDEVDCECPECGREFTENVDVSVGVSGIEPPPTNTLWSRMAKTLEGLR